MYPLSRTRNGGRHVDIVRTDLGSGTRRSMAGECYYRLPSEVDIDGRDKLRSELLELVNAGTGDVVADCIHLEFIDSIGVAVIAQMRRLLAVHHRTLRLVNLSPHPRRPFELLGLAELFGFGEVGSA